MRFSIKSKLYGVLIFTVDPEDAHFLRNYVWTPVKGQKGDHIYLRRTELGVSVALHRKIAGATPSDIVRFRNGDQRDLRRCNLIVEGISDAREAMIHYMHAINALNKFVVKYQRA